MDIKFRRGQKHWQDDELFVALEQNILKAGLGPSLVLIFGKPYDRVLLNEKPHPRKEAFFVVHQGEEKYNDVMISDELKVSFYSSGGETLYDQSV